MEPLGTDDPTQVGRYRLLRRLGAGGMGRVYLGRTAGGRTVAVKVVRVELTEDPEFRARFRQEVAAARLVGGDWTAPVLDADTEGEHPWVATGYVAGPALGAAVRDFGPLPAAAVRAMGAALAGALAHVHARGLVHRDVKPSNVLLTLDGPRLIDFGIARALDAATGLTRSGFVVGSPGYMSPEQAQGAPVGAPGDVFALGAVLAYAATGVAPFGDGVSAAVLLYRVVHEEPDLSRLDPGLRVIVRDCLAKDPAARPQPAALRDRLLAGGAGTAVAAGRTEGAATVRLRPGGGWLPPALAAAVGRSAVELLDLEAEPTGAAAARTVGAEPGPPGRRPGDGAPRDRDPAGGAVTTGAVTTGAVTAGAATAGAVTVGAFTDHAPTDRTPTDAPPVAAPRGRGRRRAAVAVALVVLGILGFARLSGWPDRSDGGAGASGTPTGAATGPSGTAFSSSSSTSSTTVSSDSTASTTWYPIDPLPSAGGPTAVTGPNAVPAAFVGVWSGDMTATHSGAPAGTTTLVIRPAAIGAETTASVNGVTGLLTVTCEGAWTLGSASEKELVYSSRLLRSTPEGLCTGGSAEETLRLQADGTIRFTSADPGAGNPEGTLRKVG